MTNELFVSLSSVLNTNVMSLCMSVYHIVYNIVEIELNPTSCYLKSPYSYFNFMYGLVYFIFDDSFMPYI